MNIICKLKQNMRYNMINVINKLDNKKLLLFEKKNTQHLLYWLHNKFSHNIHVALFANLNNEIGTRQLDFYMMKSNINRYLPIMKKNIYSLGKIPDHKNCQNLDKGYLNIPNPPEHTLNINFSDVDILIIPGLAFDIYGNRLGRGKGYYDRSMKDIKLKNKKLIKLGLAFDCQIVDFIPTNAYDQNVDYFCTPNYGVKKTNIIS